MHLSILLPLLLCSLDVTLSLVSNSGSSDGPVGTTVDSTAPAALMSVSEAQKSPDEPSVIRHDVGKYTVLARDGSNVTDTEEFLKSKIEGGQGLFQVFHGEDVIAWGNVTLTPDAKSEVENHKGVWEVTESKTVSWNRALPSSDYSKRTPRNSTVTNKRTRLHKRADPWKKQLTLDDNGLKVISQYTGSEVDDLNYFVYPPNPGSNPNTYIYFIDRGVQLDVKNSEGNKEFRSVRSGYGRAVIQTWLSAQTGEQMRTDDNVKDSHGTMAASKAAGKMYGVAKEATLISVKMVDENADLTNAFNYILHNLKAHRRQQSRSVVITSTGIGIQETYANSQNSPTIQRLYKQPIQELFDMGVPVVCAAGNDDKGTRPQIDQLPMVLADEDFPIINVGSADYEGRREPHSQVGEVTLYAPGLNVLCQTKVDSGEKTETGTSIAAPQVAGLIATYMSYTIKPWDDSLTGIDRVKAIRAYLVSDQSSWIRPAGVDPDPTKSIRVAWNGATKDIHDDAEEVIVDDLPDTDEEEDAQSTPAPQPTAEPAPAPAPTPERRNKALSIIMQHLIDPISNDVSWQFFESDYGVSSLCRAYHEAALSVTIDGPSAIDNPAWPGGTFTLRKLDKVDCDYLNDGSNPGALWCQDRNEAKPENGEKEKKVMISCREEDRRWNHEAEICSEGDLYLAHHPVVTCDW